VARSKNKQERKQNLHKQRRKRMLKRRKAAKSSEG
jgi:hypothetical protein